MIYEHFIGRLILCLISGLLFIAAFRHLAISNPVKELPTTNKYKWIGIVFYSLCAIQLIAFIYFFTQIVYPITTAEPIIPPDGIVRNSSVHIVWGYATPMQRFAFTFFIGTFACFGFAQYFFKFKLSPSKWWSKILKFIGYVFVWMLYVNSTDFHYFDTFEWIKTGLYLFSLWICFARSSKPKKDKVDEATPFSTTNNVVPPPYSEAPKEAEIVTSISDHSDIVNDDVNISEEIYSSDSTENSDSVVELSDSTIRYCRFCGSKIDSDSKFCKYCGKQLDSDEMKFSNRVFAFMDSIRKKINSFFHNLHKRISKPSSNSRKHDIRKILKYIGISFASILILVGIGCGLWYYFDQILPQNRANEIYNEELSSLNSLSDDELFDKCEDIIRNHNISKSGKSYLDENNLRELTDIAWNKINSLAENGNADAQFILGLRFGGYNFNIGDWDFRRYNGGDYINQYINFNKSAYWYLKAAEQGHATAQNNIGRYYEIGRGVSENKREALRWYRLSAQNNDALGLLNLGDSFRDGLKEQNGTQWIKDPDCYYCNWQHKCERHTYPTYATILQCDIDSAKYYWQKSAELGNQEAKDRLQQIY